MKLEEKQFNIYEGERPKVLLLGNGLCRSFDGMSWDALLDSIKDSSKYKYPSKKYMLPMPLKAVMLTNNSLSEKMRKLVDAKKGDSSVHDNSQFDWDSFVKTNDEMRMAIRDLVGDRFDFVLTTNYSYEIEASLLEESKLTQNRILNLMNYYEVENPQLLFFINTFNMCGSVPIWHIHGEARKPNSMIIGNHYYGKLLRKCVERLDGSNGRNGKLKEVKNNIEKELPQKIGSWIDAFVFGDVYILGFGLDFSESDLWWLIEFKKNNNEYCGKTIFYNPIKDTQQACLAGIDRDCYYPNTDCVSGKQCLSLILETYGVITKDLGVSINKDDDYRRFYEVAISDIKKCV